MPLYNVQGLSIEAVFIPLSNLAKNAFEAYFGVSVLSTEYEYISPLMLWAFEKNQ